MRAKPGYAAEVKKLKTDLRITSGCVDMCIIQYEAIPGKKDRHPETAKFEAERDAILARLAEITTPTKVNHG